MHKFPILYSRTSTGAIQQWQIIVDGDHYWTESGQVGGTITVGKPTYCKPKSVGRANETTADVQAMADATSKHKKKLKQHNFENIADIDEVHFIEPMLAKKLVDYREKINFADGVGVQLKLNGVRCIATREGLFSRKGERYVSIPHIEKSLWAFFQANPDAVLDGELFNDDLRQQLNKIVSLARKTVHATPAEIAESEELVRYYVYDGYNFTSDNNGISAKTGYRARAVAIKSVLSDNPYYRHVPTYVCRSEAEVTALHDKFVAQGHEGVMVRLLDSPYENKRSANLLKMKPTDDDEFELIGWEEGDGKRAGMFGKLQFRFHDGREFGANPKGGDETNIATWKIRETLKGKKFTVYYNGFNGKGLPNFAQFDCANYNKGDR